MGSNSELEKALVLQQSGKINQALSLYNQIIKLSPNNDSAYYFAALAYRDSNHFNTAINYLKKAIQINPQNVYYKAMGIVYYKAKDIQSALDCFLSCLDVEPNDIEILGCIGEIYLQTHSFNESIAIYEKIFLIDNNNFDALFNLGVAYSNKNELNVALSAFQKSLEIKQDCWESYFYCAKILMNLKDAVQSDLYYKKALELNPDNAEIYFYQGILYQLCERPDLAIEPYETAIVKQPDYIDAYVNLGGVYRAILDWDSEIKLYREALNRNLQSDKLFFNLGTSLNMIGNYSEGMPYYEHRSGVFPHHQLKFPQNKFPKWDISLPTKNKTVLVYCAAPDFSFGDTVMFSRYLPKLAEMGANVICRAQSIVRPLLDQSDLGATYIDINQNDVEFDYQIPIMSLATAFKTTVETIPFKQGHLKANLSKVNLYKEKYFNNNKFKIGICWRGGLGNDLRSCDFNNFSFLADVEDIQVYSLQKGFGVDELESVGRNFDIIDLGSTFNDFSDTAAALKNLDLVITIDTAMSHIAGGLNIPTFVLLPYMPEWRWGVNTSSSYWYDSVRLFRQKQHRDWTSVFDELKKEVKDLL